MSQIIWILPVLVGFLIPLQAKFNGQLFEISKDAVLTGLISVTVTTVFVALSLFALERPLTLPQAPWWVYLGGLCGALYVVAVSFLASRLPLTTLVTGLLAGQVVMSIILDYLNHGTFSVRQIFSCFLVGGAVLLNFKN